MDENAAAPFCETCLGCRREFHFPGALKNHQHSCSKSKKRLSGALEKAKVLWTNRKRQRIDSDANGSQQTGSSGFTSLNDVEEEVCVIYQETGPEYLADLLLTGATDKPTR